MKQSFLTTLSAFVFFAFFLTSCQNDEVAGPNGQLSSRAAPTCNDGIQNGSETGVDCGGSKCPACPILYNWSDNDACEGQDLTVTFCNGLGSNCGHTQIQQWIGGQWIQVANATPVNGCLSYTVTGAAIGSYLFRAQWVSSGGGCSGANTGWVEYTTDVAACAVTCEIEAGDYFTYSHGFYMNSPNGATFLNAHPELGPVTVGCEAGTTTTYSLADIIAMDAGNSTPPGILVKQIITMTLNVSASLGNSDDLACLVVVSDGNPATTFDDIFAGMTVSEILDAANAYAGGCDTTSFSSGNLTGILGAIVANFHLGEVNGGLLTCCGA
jgi:hypothetical protein